jgi:hypothetical protein
VGWGVQGVGCGMQSCLCLCAPQVFQAFLAAKPAMFQTDACGKPDIIRAHAGRCAPAAALVLGECAGESTA